METSLGPFIHLPEYSVIVCRDCRYAVVSAEVASHLRGFHAFLSAKERASIQYAAAGLSGVFRNQDELRARFISPSPTTSPIPLLGQPKQDGLGCNDCPFIARQEQSMRRHRRKVHGDRTVKRGGHRHGHSAKGYATPYRTGVWCQRFFRSRIASSWFEVGRGMAAAVSGRGSGDGDADQGNEGASSNARSHLFDNHLEDAISRVLAEDEACEQAHLQAAPIASFSSQDDRIQSAWLKTTQWAQFLAPHQKQLQGVAALASLQSCGSSSNGASITGEARREGDEGAEAILAVMVGSVDRIVSRARDSLDGNGINVFDQHRLNSFMAGRSSRKPFYHDLKPETYRRYTSIVQQLVCFVFRTAWHKTGPQIHHRLTDPQSVSLAGAVHAAAEVVQSRGDGLPAEPATEVEKRLDDNLLMLLISLLDHELFGNIYDSVVVGFLAVIGIRPPSCKASTGRAPQLFYEAVDFTPRLSGLIKISQLLVAERAILAVERDEQDVPARALEAMQARFMCHDSRSPIAWALKLRSFGKAVKDNTTSLGYIAWSDDSERLAYKKIQLTMTGIRELVKVQLQAAQDLLAEVLLVPPDTAREDIVPTISLRSVADDPSEGEAGWNFVQHPENTMLHGHERWLLNRVMRERELRNDFFQSPTGALWRPQIVSRYVTDVNLFLERLLLLVHISGGQPARGTELLCIQHSNATDGSGSRRNIFIENGLVSFVTFYHKGYSITGSTKIIHRYLPSEIGELLVYYVWLVMPFLRQLSTLAKLPGFSKTLSPYLWGEFAVDSSFMKRLAGSQDERKGRREARKLAIRERQASKTLLATLPGRPWVTARLSSVLQREFSTVLGVGVTIQTWRHVAIAISRRHLQQAKFKRDFIEAVSWAWNDEMAAHSTKIAGLTYARGLDEAPGHIAGAKAEYRRISREWHAWLGFGGIKK